MENLEEVHNFVQGYRPYANWRLLQRQSLKDGLQAGDVAVVAEYVLKLARTGLERRDMGEEELLAPLVDRVRLRMSPGHIKRELFRDRGIGALLDQLLIS